MEIRNKKGFTLIELLVVVAIIGLLSSVVLASLNSARAKAKDAAVKEGVSQFANLLTFNYDEYGSYCQLIAPSGWIDAYVSCNSSFSGNYATQARAICNNILNNSGEPWGNRLKIYIYTYSGDCTKTYLITVALNNGNWFCYNSTGKKSESLFLGCL